MVPLSMTLIDPERDFMVVIFFHIEYLRNDMNVLHHPYFLAIRTDILCPLITLIYIFIHHRDGSTVYITKT